MAERGGRLRQWRCALGLGAMLALSACAPLPVADSDAAARTSGACSAQDGQEACPPGAVAQPAHRPSRTRPALPAAAPAPMRAPPVAPSAEQPSPEPVRESDEQGLASWYGPGLHGRRTASGERFDRYELTAAHRTLPFGSRVCVRSVVTGKTVVVRINDRGPFTEGRVIDLSQGAAQQLGMTGLGIKPVELWLLDKDDETCPDSLPVLAPDAGDEAVAEAAPAARKAVPAQSSAKAVRKTTRRPVRTGRNRR